MSVVSIRSVEHKNRGVKAVFKVLPMKTGFVVQRISWESELDGSIERGGWSEAWVVRKKPRYLEQGLVDLFAVPADWIENHTGTLRISAFAWFQTDIPTHFKRIQGQTDRWGRLRGTEELVDVPGGAMPLERAFYARWTKGGEITLDHRTIT